MLRLQFGLLRGGAQQEHLQCHAHAPVDVHHGTVQSPERTAGHAEGEGTNADAGQSLLAETLQVSHPHTGHCAQLLRYNEG